MILFFIADIHGDLVVDQRRKTVAELKAMLSIARVGKRASAGYRVGNARGFDQRPIPRGERSGSPPRHRRTLGPSDRLRRSTSRKTEY